MDLERKLEKINVDCVYFKGYIPCSPHKEKGVHCENCSDYKKINKKILILKIGAAGEVLRTTPLLRRLNKEYPNSRIFWLTQYPELISKTEIFKVYNFTQREIELIKNVEFDIIYSLDKHEEIGALANQIKSKVKKGFSQKDGAVVPFDKDAEERWRLSLFDDIMKKNQKHHVEILFETCGFKFEGEKYILPKYHLPKVELDKGKKIVALNTGTGDQWKPREYSAENWVELSKLLLERQYEIMLVGGEKEDEKNKKIAKESGAKYFGTFSSIDFMGLLDLSDIVVTAVSFGLHVAIGLEKKVVLVNNVFNKNEFYMYGHGVVLEPDLPCLMCYKSDFDSKCPSIPCMNLVKPEKIVEEIEKFTINKNLR